MPLLEVDLKNCYGIREFKDKFKFDTGPNIEEKIKAYAIYAPNGSMKSSFAETMMTFRNPVKGEPRDTNNHFAA